MKKIQILIYIRFFILAQDERKKKDIKKEFKYLTEAHRYFHFSNEKVNNQISFYWSS